MQKREKVKAEAISTLEKNKRVVYEGEEEKVKEWTIYLWLDYAEGVYYAVAKVKGQLYGQGFRIEKGISFDKKDTEVRRYWLARRNATTNIENTLNVLEMYGKKVLDSEGNIVWEEVQHQERLYAWYRALRKTRKFPIIVITENDALKMKLS